MNSDLTIENGDLAVENGQLKLLVDDNNIQTAILRRIKTPINIYSKAIVNPNGELLILDNDYGNISYELTSLDSQYITEQVKDNLTELISKDPRVELVSINIESDIIEGVQVVINYYIPNNEEMQRLII